VTVIKFQMCCCVQNFTKSDDFSLRYGDLTTLTITTSAIFNFRNSVYGTSTLSPCYSASPHKMSLKSAKIGCWVMPKRCLKWRPSAILNLKIFHIWSLWLSSSSKFAVIYQISSKSDDFSLRYNHLTICNMAAIRHLDFSKFRVFVIWPMTPLYSALCEICHWNKTTTTRTTMMWMQYTLVSTNCTGQREERKTWRSREARCFSSKI